MKKDGFIARVTVVQVMKEQLTLEDVTLVPSADYVNAYNARNKRMRLFGYLGIGLAAAGFLAAVAIDRFGAEPLYQNEFRPRQEVLEAVSIGRAGDGSTFTTQLGQQCYGDPDKCRTDARGIASNVGTLQALTWVMVGVGAAGAIAAAYCFIAGEDPNRYTGLVASMGPEGGTIGFAGHW